jgi:excinuclease UvrABC helicase subunit UvrB
LDSDPHLPSAFDNTPRLDYEQIRAVSDRTSFVRSSPGQDSSVEHLHDIVEVVSPRSPALARLNGLQDFRQVWRIEEFGAI